MYFNIVKTYFYFYSGDKTVVNSGNFDTESCQIERFQPFSFVTSQGNNCIYKKTICNEEGQLIYSNGTSVYDRNCRCDYTKNFSYVSTKRVDMCSCDPTAEDCSCYIKLCSVGQVLTPGKNACAVYIFFSLKFRNLVYQICWVITSLL